MSLNTAEGITRYLRSKDTSVTDITKAAYALVNGEIDVNLPNRTSFVLELLCDRLNDSKTHKFRVDPEVWRLLKVTWNASKAEAARSRCLRSIKVSDILVSTYTAVEAQGLSPKQVLEVLDASLDTAKTILDDFYQQTSENMGLSILSHYLTLLTLTKDVPLVKIDTWTEIVSTIFHSAVLGTASKLNKKTTTAFTRTCVPKMLSFMSAASLPAASLRMFDTMFTRTLYHRDLGVPNLKFNVEVLLKGDTTLTDASLGYLFQTTIKLLFKSDFGLCEEIFKVVTAAVPDLTETLLSLLSQSNRTLSPEFLSSIMATEFAAASKNWVLISHLLDLDVDLALTYGNQIFAFLATALPAEYSMSQICESLLVAFIKAREFTTFFSLWSTSIQQYPESVWTQDPFMDLVSARIKELTSAQLERLVSHLLEFIQTEGNFNSRIIPLTVIVQGLFDCTDKNVLLVRGLLMKPIATQQVVQIGPAHFWKFQYNLLCLYADYEVKELERLVVVAQQVEPKNEFVFYALFRIREMHAYDISEVAAQFLVYFETRKTDLTLALRFMDRWMVLVNCLFSKEDIRRLVKALVSAPSDQFLCQLFQNNTLYEQRVLANAVIDEVTSLLKGGENTAQLLPLLMWIPVQCMSKFHKTSLLNILTALAHDAVVQAPALCAMQHLLVQPAILSDIESTIDVTYQLLGAAPADSVIEIFSMIWRHKVNQISEKHNHVFVEATFKSLRTFFKKSAKGIAPELRVALAVITSSAKLAEQESAFHAQLVALRTSFTGCVNTAITERASSDSTDNISWLLNALYVVDDDRSGAHTAATRVLVKSIGAEFHARGDVRIRVSLFQLASKIADRTYSQTVYLLALYTALREADVPYTPALTDAYAQHLAALSPAAFSQSLEFLLASYETPSAATATSMQCHVELLVVFWKHFGKDSVSQDFFSRSLSATCGLLQAQSTSLFTNSALCLLLTSVKAILVDSTWLLTQYSIEVMLMLVTVVASRIGTRTAQASEVDVYVLCTQVVSNILLFHRYRLSNRNHLLISTFVVLMDGLALRSKKKATAASNVVPASTKAAGAYARLLSNLCEPQTNAVASHQDKTSLTSTNSLIKRLLRKHVPVLLINFVHISLKYLFDNAMKQELIPGIYNVFDVLSASELSLVSSSLDVSGKAFYKTLFDDYKKFGKWKDE
ncbi:hypothetical protein BABINDRAFT_6587 [Babjeviella inositovora NRRL Y-12698]|uniref:Nucleolar 27S pre-rRNA processing Urb2/Npa2 C-terminal domain-containing protein n=1 Tax=Babjeviella inositovora NRRL Y-12698 TaxID=984486 RepID=A0A1E3QWT3_9ASCO|nr:uncharacterized protein BABINDRAFT_6587 [Babjeviella inositovora NRRL Y-12698]ODQ81964.1 hypothetical protein BABINDRAFT_6587 [Babjeviella inositovora NRRL Y-12698]